MLSGFFYQLQWRRTLLHFQFYSAIKREGEKQDSQISGKLKIKICTAELKSFSTTLQDEENTAHSQFYISTVL